MHLALARKYRPQTFADVVGQEHVSVTLGNALAEDRLHHAYLFCGARGVGKTTVARILAKAVNCTARNDATEPCNTCASCEEITTGRSLDVQEIDGASNNGIDDVREIREHLKYLPSGERYKIYIIDEVHMLSASAFNALLKTLEEPPPHVIFVFATTEPHKIPATILSRCQRYDFRRLGTAKIITTIQAIAKTEDYQIDEDVLGLIAYEAEGSLRDAESLLDQVVAFAGKAVTIDKVRELLGFTDRATVMQLVEAIVAHDIGTALEQFESVFQSGGNIPRLAQELLETFRHLWVITSCGKLPHRDELPAAVAEKLEALAETTTAESCEQCFSLMYRGIDDIMRGRFPKLAMESLLLRLVQVESVVPMAELIAQVETMMDQQTKGVVGRPSSVVGVQADNMPNAGDTVESQQLHDDSLPDLWTPFTTWLSKNVPQLGSVVAHGTVHSATPEGVNLAFPKDSIYAEILKETERTKQFESLLREHLGPKCTLQITTLDGPSAQEQRATEHAHRTEKRGEAHKDALQHHLVQEAHRILGAEVKEVKVLK